MIECYWSAGSRTSLLLLVKWNLHRWSRFLSQPQGLMSNHVFISCRWPPMAARLKVKSLIPASRVTCSAAAFLQVTSQSWLFLFVVPWNQLVLHIHLQEPPEESSPLRTPSLLTPSEPQHPWLILLKRKRCICLLSKYINFHFSRISSLQKHID